MRYYVAKLREAADQALAAERAQVQKDHEKSVAQYDQKLTDWASHYAEKWAQAARVIGRKARAGKPITREDMPRDEYGRRATFDSLRPGECPKGMSTDLRIVRAALDLITDETVSPTELAKLGVRASELRTVFYRASQA